MFSPMHVVGFLMWWLILEINSKICFLLMEGEKNHKSVNYLGMGLALFL